MIFFCFRKNASIRLHFSHDKIYHYRQGKELAQSLYMFYVASNTY